MFDEIQWYTTNETKSFRCDTKGQQTKEEKRVFTFLSFWGRVTLQLGTLVFNQTQRNERYLHCVCVCVCVCVCTCVCRAIWKWKNREIKSIMLFVVNQTNYTHTATWINTKVNLVFFVLFFFFFLFIHLCHTQIA